MTFYVSAVSTLGQVRDYANAKSESAPVFTKGVSSCLKMRVFASTDSPEPYPVAELAKTASWQWVMDDDFDSTSNYILVADHAQIKVQSVTETINGEEYTFTEFTIPLPEMNTEELNTLLGKNEQVATLNGELVGFDGSGAEVFVLQVKGFTVRNRISSTGNPTALPSEFLNESGVRALLNCGFEIIFAESGSDTAADWHAEQTGTDKFIRIRLGNDERVWADGSAAEYGWSDAVALPAGVKGDAGLNGKNMAAAFAADSAGTGFTLDVKTLTGANRYLALLQTDKEPGALTAEDFAGLWFPLFAPVAAADAPVTDAGEYFAGENVETVLQEIGSTLSGLETMLAEI